MSDPILKIEGGQIRGKTSQDYLGGTFYSFLGIPYGKAPVGELRFKPPEPVEPWEGIKDATKEGPECPSRHMMLLYRIGSEDNCLNLNVYTPELPGENVNPKPVMVWIHGGGFLYGSNRSDFYGPDYLITEDIVLVCINYRLGVLGFLSLEDSSLGVPGNAGLKDMILALKWVQKNIKYFSGDPNNVTIFGESAGSASVHYLYLSPLSKGLFHKAIAQSGCSLNSWAMGCNNATIIAKNLGYEETDERKILEYLKQLPANKIVDGQHKMPDPFTPRNVRPFGPVVENNSQGAFLSQKPIEIIKNGNFNKVPLIMGYTSKEGMLFEAIRQLQLVAGYDITSDFENEISADLNLEKGSEKSLRVANKIKKFYFGDEDPSEENIDKLYSMRTDNMFLYGIHESIQYQKLASPAPIYFYKMTLDTSLNQFKRISTTKHVYVLMFIYFLANKLGDGMIKNFLNKLAKKIPQKNQDGTCHADDLGYLFKSFMSDKIEVGSEEEVYVKRFVKMWTNFARSGNPTPDEDDPLLKVQWMPVSKEKNWCLEIGSELKMEDDPDGGRIEFWEKLHT